MPGRVTVTTHRWSISRVMDGLGAAGFISYPVEYAAYVNWPTEYVTGPPFGAIREWVHRKWGDLDGGLKDAARSDGMDAGSEAHRDAVAWMIRNSINAKGTPGIYFAERALEAGRRASGALASPYADSNDPEAPGKLVADALDYMFGISQDIIADEATDRGVLLRSGVVIPDELPSAEPTDAGGDSGPTDGAEAAGGGGGRP